MSLIMATLTDAWKCTLIQAYTQIPASRDFRMDVRRLTSIVALVWVEIRL